MNPNRKSLDTIKEDVARHEASLDELHAAREEVRGYTSVPVQDRHPVAKARLNAMLMEAPTKRTFNMLAQGDSWFDYPIGTDLVDCLHSVHGHTITNLAVAGSTLNDEAYGPAPKEMFGLPFGLPQSNDPDRITELVRHLRLGNKQGSFKALLLSAGGNDVAGDEFFSFVNNARSGLPAVNRSVLDGVVNGTFKSAYQYLIDTAIAASDDAGMSVKVFTHGYDYPFPDGRGVVSFLAWKVGPWFDPTFNRKNFPNKNPGDLNVRYGILVEFIDALNAMLASLAADPKYAGRLFHVDLRETLSSAADWANELHPTNAGFRSLAARIDAALQQNI